MKIYVLVKPHANSDYKEIEITEKPKSVSYSLPNEKAANLVMDADGFSEYIAKHGYHFTDKLAQFASEMMVNRNGLLHRWTPLQIQSRLHACGYDNYDKCTLGDITYLANMAYADFYPEVIKDEMSCIKFAIAVIEDPDGYKGIAMSRWIADLIGKEIHDVLWNKFI